MNTEFQKLKCRLNQVDGDAKNEILNKMRENLMERNDKKGLYTLGYTHEGETIDIMTCGEQDLLKIDGDMVVYGK